MVSVITYLFGQLITPVSQRTASSGGSSVSDSNDADTSITSFDTSFSANLDINFSWNINIGKQQVKKVELYHNDNELIKDVTSNVAYSQSFMTSGYDVGNNLFKLVVTLKGGKKLERSNYLYINEAFGFNATSGTSNKKFTVTASYYYENAKPVNAPKVSYIFNSSNIDEKINWVRNEVVSNDGRFTKVNSIYEMSLDRVDPGSYKADFTWTFDEYNVEYTSNSSFEVVGD